MLCRTCCRNPTIRSRLHNRQAGRTALCQSRERSFLKNGLRKSALKRIVPRFFSGGAEIPVYGRYALPWVIRSSVPGGNPKSGRLLIYLPNIMSYHPLWPDFTLRHDDPAALAVPTQELLKIIRALMTLNQTGTCTAFYEYYAHVGIFEITLFEGRWNYRKKPIARYNIDCRNDPLLDEDTQMPVNAERLIENMILQVL